MPRRFNYTGRKRIGRGDMAIRLHRDENRLWFDAHLKLDGYRLEQVDSPPKVYVEAYRGASAQWKRFDFGSFDTRQPPADCSLNDFGVPEGILFRVKVTGTGVDTDGLLLAAADAIRPRLPDERDDHVQPLIQHMAADDIGDELWRLDFSGEMPLLKINSRVPVGVEQFLRDPQHRATIVPAVMRQILTRILVVDRDCGDEDDEADWRQLWLRFTKTLGLNRPPEPEENNGRLDNLDELTEWIDSAVEAFAAKAGLFRQIDEAAT